MSTTHEITPTTVAHAAAPGVRPSHTRSALLVALASAAAFGTSGPFAKALFATGWSPAAAVTMRVGIAALVLAIPTIRELHGQWHLLRRNAVPVALYGLFGIAGCQLFYFVAVQHLSVGVALLLEYLSPTLLVAWTWSRTRQRPARLTLIGAALALAGLMLVLDIFGSITIDAVGVLFGLAAAVCSATYFVVAAAQPEDGLSPLALSGSGMAVGVLPLLALGGLGVFPLHASTAPVTFAGTSVSVWVPVLGISLVAAVFAYISGVVAARMLGTRVASFVALAEVLFAVLFAWLFLGELPLPVQLLGGALIVAGVVLVHAADRASSLAD